MTQYIGLDAHSKTCTAVVMDSKGKILKKEVFPTSERELLRFVDSVKRPRVLTFEEMNIAQWLYVLLKDRVDQVQVAHAPLHQRSLPQLLIGAAWLGLKPPSGERLRKTKQILCPLPSLSSF